MVVAAPSGVSVKTVLAAKNNILLFKGLLTVSKYCYNAKVSMQLTTDRKKADKIRLQFSRPYFPIIYAN